MSAPSFAPAALGWMARAACRGRPLATFFPGGEGHEFDAAIARAKQVCRTCPVAHHCLRHALEAGERGIWAGTTDTDRAKLRRRSRRRAR